MIRALLLAMAVYPAAAGAQIYKCTDDQGHPVFSDMPCADNAETVEVDIPAATGMDMGGGDFSKVERANAAREAERRVARVEQYISRIERDHSRKLSKINDKIADLDYGRIDESSREKLYSERKRVNDAYYKKRRSAYRELGKARAERSIARAKNSQ